MKKKIAEILQNKENLSIEEFYNLLLLKFTKAEQEQFLTKMEGSKDLYPMRVLLGTETVVRKARKGEPSLYGAFFETTRTSIKQIYDNLFDNPKLVLGRDKNSLIRKSTKFLKLISDFTRELKLIGDYDVIETEETTTLHIVRNNKVVLEADYGFCTLIKTYDFDYKKDGEMLEHTVYFVLICSKIV